MYRRVFSWHFVKVPKSAAHHLTIVALVDMVNGAFPRGRRGDWLWKSVEFSRNEDGFQEVKRSMHELSLQNTMKTTEFKIQLEASETISKRIPNFTGPAKNKVAQTHGEVHGKIPRK